MTATTGEQFTTSDSTTAGAWPPRIAEAHQPYVHDADRSGEALGRLAEVTPTVVKGTRPLVSVTRRDPRAGLAVVPFQNPDTGRYMNILTGVEVELAPELVAALARKVEANRRHFPREDTFAATFGVPGLYIRLDCFLTVAEPWRSGMGGNAVWSSEQWRRVALAVCELDDQPAFVGSFLRGGHRTAFDAFARLAGELALLGRPLRLAEDDRDPAFYTLDNYPHDDRLWLRDMGVRAVPEASAAIVRARRGVPGSRRFLERWTPASIFPGSGFRDYKGVLGIPGTVDRELGLGVLVRDHLVARRVIERAHRDGLGTVVAKGLFSARKESAMAISPGSRVPASHYRLSQLSRLGYAGDDGGEYLQPLVLQPAYTPPTFRNMGIRLTAADAEAVRGHPYRLRSGRVGTGEDVFAHPPIPGNEARFHGLFRLYFVYLPSENLGERKRPRFVGGLLQGCTTPMAIHGSNGALTVWVRPMEPESWPRVEYEQLPFDDGPPWVDVARLPRFAPEYGADPGPAVAAPRAAS